MKTIKIIFFSVFLYFGLSEVNRPTYAQTGKYTKLRYGYSIQIFPEIHCFEACDDLNRLTILKDGRTIFKDSSNQYHVSKNELYPLLLHLGSNHDEILVRASHNRITRVSIKNGHVHKVDTLPCFGGAVRDSASLEFSTEDFDNFGDFLDNDVASNDNCKLIYKPFLIYRLSKQALSIDSEATEGFNRLIYGHFYGYTRSDTLSFSPIKTIEKWIGRKEHLDHLYLSQKALRTILNDEF